MIGALRVNLKEITNQECICDTLSFLSLHSYNASPTLPTDKLEKENSKVYTDGDQTYTGKETTLFPVLLIKTKFLLDINFVFNEPRPFLNLLNFIFDSQTLEKIYDIPSCA